jgi:hypothetical protein
MQGSNWSFVSNLFIYLATINAINARQNNDKFVEEIIRGFPNFILKNEFKNMYKY